MKRTPYAILHIVDDAVDEIEGNVIDADGQDLTSSVVGKTLKDARVILESLDYWLFKQHLGPTRYRFSAPTN